ncbi:MAG: DMT family transporter [bacterium]
MSTHRKDNQWLGTGLYLICILSMVLISMIVKLTSNYVPVQQILLVRFGLSLIPLVLIAIISRKPVVLRTRRYSDHAIRSIAGVCSIGLFFVAISFVPLATATALAYTAPIFCVVLSIPLLGEIVGIRRWTAVLIGFGGVLLISWPGSSVWGAGSFAAIGSALCGGFVMVYLRKLSDTESALTSSLYYNLFGTIVFALWCFSVGWSTIREVDWWWLLGLGLLAGIQQFSLASAFRFAEATFLAPFEYLILVFAGIAGFLVWGEVPGVGTWLGGIVISGAGIFMIYRGNLDKPALS